MHESKGNRWVLTLPGKFKFIKLTFVKPKIRHLPPATIISRPPNPNKRKKKSTLHACNDFMLNLILLLYRLNSAIDTCIFKEKGNIFCITRTYFQPNISFYIYLFFTCLCIVISALFIFYPFVIIVIKI